MPSAPAIGDRETIVAIVAPVGGPVDGTVDTLISSFQASGYKAEPLRISTLIDTTVPALPDEEGMNRARLLMNKGDRLRTRLDNDAACAYLAAQAISRARKAVTGSTKKHRPRHVTILRSLKTPDEVKVLRQIYGERVIVVGVSSSEQQRLGELTRKLRKDGMSRSDAAGEASQLLQRDERDEATTHGQRMRDAYRLADAFLAAKSTQDDQDATRLVNLLLGEPWITPSRTEQGMFHGWAAKFRSSAAGRQVGAAIVDELGEVIAVGCNDVPRPHGGQFWPEHTDDRRDFRLGYDANDRGKFETAEEALRGLADAGWLDATKAGLDPANRASLALEQGGPLDNSRLTDLIEFGRIVHAEMAALMTAAREGRAVKHSTIYTTTYPCHECARLIIAAGIVRVVYIDPYDKSLAGGLYEEMWDDSGHSDRVHVEAFVGVSPRLFQRVFEISNRVRDETGNYEKWDQKRRTLVTSDEEFTDSIPEQEKAAGAYLKYLIDAAKVREAAVQSSTTESQPARKRTARVAAKAAPPARKRGAIEPRSDRGNSR
jgi:cytidine deaminase